MIRSLPCSNFFGSLMALQIFIRSFFYLVLTCFNFSLHAQSDGYVTCWLSSGQLGNQLYEIATTLAFAWDHDKTPLFPGLEEKQEHNIPMNRKRLFFRLDTTPLPRPIANVFENYVNWEYFAIPNQPDLLLQGYFQTWRYFHHHRDKLVELFTPSDNELASIKLKYQELLSHPNTVAVHVRTFNKYWNREIPFVGLKYYEEAKHYFPEDALFVVFSDRINWCKKYFAEFGRPIVFIDAKEYIEEFILMSLLKHHIIANSSFSWWSAYLNQNPEKIVVAPSHFKRPQAYLHCQNCPCLLNANLPEWITLQIDYDHVHTPYPKDITYYDGSSQSLDTQTNDRVGPVTTDQLLDQILDFILGNMFSRKNLSKEQQNTCDIFSNFF